MSNNFDHSAAEAAAHNTHQNGADTGPKLDECGRPEKPSMLQIALDHARRGFLVFPVIPNGKVPSVGGWNHQATTNPEFIRHWWTQRDPVIDVIRERDHNVGVATGGDLLVLDIDIKKVDGEAAMAVLALENGFPSDWQDTLTVRTTSGGRHLFFKTSEELASSVSKLGPGIDTRGAGGYVVAAGSVVNGKSYTIVRDLPLREIPPQLAALIGKPMPKHERGAAVFVGDDEGLMLQGEQYLEQRAPAVQGAGGNDHTFRTACRLKDLGLSQLAVLELMLGAWNERCSPPWSVDEMATVVSNAFEYGKRPPGADSAAADFGDDPLPDDGEDAGPGREGDAGDEADGAAKAAPEGPRFMTLEHVRATGGTKPDFLIKKALDRVGSALFSGISQVGKTALLLHLAGCLASGRPWFGNRIKHTGATLFLVAESPATMPPRVEAMHRHYFSDAPSHVNGILWKETPEDKRGISKWIDAEIAAAKIYAREKMNMELRLVVIDTGVAAFGVDEDDDVGVATLLQRESRRARKHDVCELITHHLGKAQDRGPRGSSAWMGNTDMTLQALCDVNFGTGEIKNRKLFLFRSKTAGQRQLGPFDIVEQDFGVDEDGEPITVPVMVEQSAAADFDIPSSLKLPQNVRKVLELLPEDGRRMRKAELRDRLVEARTSKTKTAAEKYIERAIAAGRTVLAEDHHHVWRVNDSAPDWWN